MKKRSKLPALLVSLVEYGNVLVMVIAATILTGIGLGIFLGLTIPEKLARKILDLFDR